MKAIQLRAIHSVWLVGRKIMTQPMGEYPGGIATVTELHPDPEAPEIVFNVKHPEFGEIGVFAQEEVELADRNPDRKPKQKAKR